MSNTEKSFEEKFTRLMITKTNNKTLNWEEEWDFFTTKFKLYDNEIIVDYVLEDLKYLKAFFVIKHEINEKDGTKTITKDKITIPSEKVYIVDSIINNKFNIENLRDTINRWYIQTFPNG